MPIVPSDRDIIEAAENKWADEGAIRIPNHPKIDHDPQADFGCWVSAWVWVEYNEARAVARSKGGS